MHGSDTLPCDLFGHSDRGDIQRSSTFTPEYRHYVRRITVRRFRHTDDGNFLLQFVEKIFSQARPPFTTQENIAIDHNTVQVLVDFPQQSLDAGQLTPEEFTRAEDLIQTYIYYR